MAISAIGTQMTLGGARLDAVLQGFDIDTPMDTHDSSLLFEQARRYVAGQQDGRIRFHGVMEKEEAEYLAGRVNNNLVPVSISLGDTDRGLIGYCQVTDFGFMSATDDIARVSGDLQLTGDTHTSQPLGAPLVPAWRLLNDKEHPITTTHNAPAVDVNLTGSNDWVAWIILESRVGNHNSFPVHIQQGNSAGGSFADIGSQQMPGTETTHAFHRVAGNDTLLRYIRARTNASFGVGSADMVIWFAVV